MIAKAVSELIGATPRITNYIARWNFGDGVERPSIHLTDPAPMEAPNPVIVIIESGGPDNEGMISTRVTDGLDVMVNIRIWGDKERSETIINQVAWEIVTLLKSTRKLSLNNNGWSEEFHRVTPPAKLTDGQGFPGYSIDLTCKLKRERS